MTENTVQRFVGVNALFTHESKFENIQITCNTCANSFGSVNLNGIVLENSNNNTINNCNVNKNMATTIAGPGQTVGIQIKASISNESKNNRITNCTIDENSQDSGASSFIGINIGGTIQADVVSQNACANTVIENCTINNNNNNNTQNSLNPVASFIGINLGGSLYGGTIEKNTCTNCSIINCTINNNKSNSSQGDALFLGINIGSTIINGSVKNNAAPNCNISSCEINNNESQSNNQSYLLGMNFGGVVVGGTVLQEACENLSINKSTINNNNTMSSDNPDNPITLVAFVGINLGGTINGGTVNAASCTNANINNITINNNSTINSNSDGESFSSLTGINLGGTISNGMVQTRVGENCFIEECTINKNSCNSQQTSLFSGINAGSAVNSVGLVANNVAANCNISSCEISNNESQSNNQSYLLGMNFGGVTARGTVLEQACENPSISKSAINNNNTTSNGNTNETFAGFVGINLGGTIDGGTVNIGACTNADINNVVINNNNIINSNSSNDNSPASFIGINLGGENNGGTVRGLGNNNSNMHTISISNNSVQSESPKESLFGINMEGKASLNDGGCNNIIATSIFVKKNTAQTLGNIVGIRISGTGNNSFAGGGNNITLKECEVLNNTSYTNSQGYLLFGTAEDISKRGAKNATIESCLAKQNITTVSTQEPDFLPASDAFDGFVIFDTDAPIFYHCTSNDNRGHGFRLGSLNSQSDSTKLERCCMKECKAINNVLSGFSMNHTNNTTITDSCSLGSQQASGFLITINNARCFVSRCIAEVNSVLGFVDGTIGGINFFAGNFAQNNGAGNYDGTISRVPISLTGLAAPTAFDNVFA